MQFIKQFIATGFLFLLIDFLWVGVFAKQLYQAKLGELLAKRARLAPAILFYLVYTLGLAVFVVQPGSADYNLLVTLGRGALFGAVAYATYDLTNLATLKKWPISLTIIDVAWGASLTAAVSAVITLVVTQ